MSNPTESVVINQAESRFEVVSGSQVSELVYQMRDDTTLDLVHTEVPEDLSGQGIGSALVTAALEYAKSHQMMVIPSCPFVASYLERHPEWTDIVVDF